VRVLDFDIENRPLSYMGNDFTTDEVTAIAASWYGDDEVGVRLLGIHTGEEILSWFKELYDQADIVTGHYIRGHDLPKINGALMELEMPTLGPKLVSDTKNDLIRRSGISASQQNLAEMYGLPEPKYSMSQIKWRKANRLLADGIEETRRRVVDDVRQHKALRTKMIELGVLKAPRLWKP
jgi:hypothetical protein